MLLKKASFLSPTVSDLRSVVRWHSTQCHHTRTETHEANNRLGNAIQLWFDSVMKPDTRDHRTQFLRLGTNELYLEKTLKLSASVVEVFPS